MLPDRKAPGKTTIVQEIVRKVAHNLPTPPGLVLWSTNFKDEYRPRSIPISPGQASRFAKSLNRLINDLKIRLPKEFQADSFREKVIEIQKRYGEKKKTHFDRLDQLAKEKQLSVERTPSGYQTIPLNGDKAFTEEEFEKLTDAQQRTIEQTGPRIFRKKSRRSCATSTGSITPSKRKSSNWPARTNSFCG